MGKKEVKKNNKLCECCHDFFNYRLLVAHAKNPIILGNGLHNY